MHDSAVFVHCPGPLRNEFKSVTPQWKDWSSWSYCLDCGSENKRFRSRLCQIEDKTVNMGLCGRGPSFEIKACHKCPEVDSSDYSLVIDKKAIYFRDFLILLLVYQSYYYYRAPNPNQLESEIDFESYLPCSMPKSFRNRKCDGYERSFVKQKNELTCC